MTATHSCRCFAVSFVDSLAVTSSLLKQSPQTNGPFFVALETFTWTSTNFQRGSTNSLRNSLRLVLRQNEMTRG